MWDGFTESPLAPVVTYAMNLRKELALSGRPGVWAWQLDKDCSNAGLLYRPLAFRCRVGQRPRVTVTAGAFETLILTKMSRETIVVLTDEKWAKFNLIVPFRLYVGKIQFYKLGRLKSSYFWMFTIGPCWIHVFQRKQIFKYRSYLFFLKKHVQKWVTQVWSRCFFLFIFFFILPPSTRGHVIIRSTENMSEVPI